MEFEALNLPDARAEGTGFPEEQVGERLQSRVLAQYTQNDARALLFHLHRRGPDVERARIEELLYRISEVFRWGVVQIGFHLENAVGFVALRKHVRALVGFAENRAQHVRARCEMARANPVPDFEGAHRGHGAEAAAKLRKNGGARRCDQFMGLVALSQGDSTEDFQGGGGREGEAAMFALNPTPALFQFGHVDGFHSESFQPDARAHDVRDGVERTNLMEVDQIRRGAVNLCFGDGDSLKDGEGVFFDELRKFTGLDEFANLRMRAGV